MELLISEKKTEELTAGAKSRKEAHVRLAYYFSELEEKNIVIANATPMCGTIGSFVVFKDGKVLESFSYDYFGEDAPDKSEALSNAEKFIETL